MKLSQFKFKLPEELIAQTPSEERDEARMMVLHKKNRRNRAQSFQGHHRLFRRWRLDASQRHESVSRSSIRK